jgi:hypothetical protein
MPSDADLPPDPVRAAVDGYTDTLRQQVAATLIKPRTPIPADELTDRFLATLANPPVIDRRLRDLPPAARKLLAVLGRTRRPRWKVGHLLTLLATVGHPEGVEPVRAALSAGLLYPDRPAEAPPLDSFDAWLASSGVLDAVVFADPQVTTRATGESFDLPDLGRKLNGGITPRVADGLEWPLRIAAVTQVVAESPVRRTMAGALFKRDLTRFQSNELLTAEPADHVGTAADLGVLALAWAAAAGHLDERDGELHTPKKREPAGTLIDAIAELVAGLPAVESWDPLLGYHLFDTGLSPFPSAVVCSLLLLAATDGWVRPADAAEWLWAHHPSWQAALGKEAQKQRGRPWVEAAWLGVLYPLRLVEVGEHEGLWVRLSDAGRHLFAGGPAPADPPAFPQTLLVQPNGEVIAYRQGLTPPLVGKLTRFARWKSFGPACTLELTAEQTYRGLESGLTIAGVTQTLNQHGTRPVPPAVLDLLQRWANKRERISVYPAATLVEFQTPADLDAALARGLVAVRVTDRIGLCSDGGEPDFKHLRLIGNRDFDARPARCVTVADDGVTLTVDAGQSDLLLEAEIGKLAEPVAGDANGIRRYRLTPASLKRAVQGGWSFDELDAWFVARTGQPLPPAGWLFVRAGSLPPSLATRRTVLQVPAAAVADGLMQWPDTRALVEDRLGPTAVTVSDDALPRLIELLAELGIRAEVG